MSAAPASQDAQPGVLDPPVDHGGTLVDGDVFFFRRWPDRCFHFRAAAKDEAEGLSELLREGFAWFVVMHKPSTCHEIQRVFVASSVPVDREYTEHAIRDLWFRVAARIAERDLISLGGLNDSAGVST